MTVFADVAGAAALLVGALLCLTSAIGLLRLPDVYARMHAASKPQALGVLLVLLGLALRLRDPGSLGMLVIAALFQMLTIPVSAHLLARAARASGDTDDAPAGVVADAPGDVAGPTRDAVGRPAGAPDDRPAPVADTGGPHARRDVR